MRNVMNLAVIIAVGVIIADLVIPSHVAGTNAVLGGVAGMWRIGVNGMLGQQTKGVKV